jgi:hypothetical protein
MMLYGDLLRFPFIAMMIPDIGTEERRVMSLRMPRNRFEQTVSDLLWEMHSEEGERPMPVETCRALVELLEMDEDEKERVANGAFYR